MKKTFKYILSILFVAVSLNSCDYLDIVPNEVPTDTCTHVTDIFLSPIMWMTVWILPVTKRSVLLISVHT